MFKKRFEKLCNERNVAPTAVCMAIGLSNATYSCWTDDSIPRRATLLKLSDYFNVPVEYFTEEGDQSTTSELSPIRQELYQKIQSLSEEQVERLILLLDSFEKRNQ